ncbi:MAG: hypothetical protein ACKO3I_01350, partial [Synechococcales cyanobacterium]
AIITGLFFPHTLTDQCLISLYGVLSCKMVSNIPKPILKNQISLLAHSGQIKPPPLCENILRIKIAQKVAIPHRPTALSIMQIELVVGQFVTTQKFISHSSLRTE